MAVSDRTCHTVHITTDIDRVSHGWGEDRFEERWRSTIGELVSESKKSQREYLANSLYTQYTKAHLEDRTHYLSQLIPLLGDKKKPLREAASHILRQARYGELLVSGHSNVLDDRAALKEFCEVLPTSRTRVNCGMGKSKFVLYRPGTVSLFIRPTAHPYRDYASVAEAAADLKTTVQSFPAPSCATIINQTFELVAQTKPFPEAYEVLVAYYEAATPADQAAALEALSILLGSAIAKERLLAVRLLLDWKPRDLNDRLGFVSKDKSKKIRGIVATYLDSQEAEFGLFSKEELDAKMAAEKGQKVRSALNEVAAKGDLLGVKYLVANRYKVAAKTSRGTALHDAAGTDNSDLVRYLIDHGCKANLRDTYGYSPLHKMNANTTVPVARMLFENGASIDCTGTFSSSPVRQMLQCGNIDVAEYLIGQGGELTTGVLRAALNACDESHIETLIAFHTKHQLPQSALFVPLASGRERRTERAQLIYKKSGVFDPNSVMVDGDLTFFQLLDQNGDLDLNRETPLGETTHNRTAPAHIVAYTRHAKDPEVLDFLIAHPAANFSLRCGDDDLIIEKKNRLETRQYTRSMATQVIRTSGRTDHLEAVFSRGIECTDDVYAQAIWAAAGGQGDVLAYLLEHHVDGFDPFRAVSKDGEETLLSLLLELSGEDSEFHASLLGNSRIAAYQKQHDLEASVQVVFEHARTHRMQHLSQGFDEELAQGSFATFCRFLESGEPRRIEAALAAIQKKPTVREPLESRYLPLIQARLGGDASLSQFVEALPKAEADGILYRLNTKNLLRLDLARTTPKECKMVADYLGGIASRFVDAPAYFEAAKSSATNKELRDLFETHADALHRGLKSAARVHPEGWYSQMCNRLREELVWVGMDHTDFNIATSPKASHFIFLLGAICTEDLRFDVFQSQAIFSEELWLLDASPTFELQESHVSVAHSPVTFRTRMYHVNKGDGSLSAG